jgi:hypothetical protein
MPTRRWIGLVVVWVVSLFAVAAIAMAQARQTVPLPEPTVLSGADVGFRVEGRQGSTAVGQIVVRMDGKWVEAVLGGGMGLQPARSK